MFYQNIFLVMFIFKNSLFDIAFLIKTDYRNYTEFSIAIFLSCASNGHTLHLIDGYNS